jgi:hypothetical protein
MKDFWAVILLVAYLSPIIILSRRYYLNHKINNKPSRQFYLILSAIGIITYCYSWLIYYIIDFLKIDSFFNAILYSIFGLSILWVFITGLFSLFFYLSFWLKNGFKK